MNDIIKKAATIIRQVKQGVIFTGAGISVASGIPTFRGEGGLWNDVDPSFIEIEYFNNNPQLAWRKIKDIFYTLIDGAMPNSAHKGCTLLEDRYNFKTIITQNIDSLHQRAGSTLVHEFHGTTELLLCRSCNQKISAHDELFKADPPQCTCGSVLKPDFVFYGEPISPTVYQDSSRAAEQADCMLIIGSAGLVEPASSLPREAKLAGAIIIEINTSPSLFTQNTTDIFINMSAVKAFSLLQKELEL